MPSAGYELAPVRYNGAQSLYDTRVQQALFSSARRLVLGLAKERQSVELGWTIHQRKREGKADEERKKTMIAGEGGKRESE
jgi:hypothetical protein